MRFKGKRNLSSKRLSEYLTKNLVKFITTMASPRRPISTGSGHLTCLFKRRTSSRWLTLSLGAHFRLRAKNSQSANFQKKLFTRIRKRILSKALWLWYFKAFHSFRTKTLTTLSLSSFKWKFQTTWRKSLPKFSHKQTWLFTSLYAHLFLAQDLSLKRLF